MAKKKQTKKTRKLTPEEMEFQSKERFFLVCIEASEKAVTPQGTAIDEFFQHQAERLKKELKELRGSK